MFDRPLVSSVVYKAKKGEEESKPDRTGAGWREGGKGREREGERKKLSPARHR